ncbi:hypothetical protein BGX27_005531, partial [Mortierella sp. AM989]
MSHFKDIVAIADGRQADVTNVIDEISILAHKTVLKTASGDLYDESFGQKLSDPKTFRLSHVLPPEFQVRSESHLEVNVAPIPPLLQAHLEATLDKDNRISAKDDLTLLLTQPHLQFLHTQFLGSRGANQNTAEANHPVWMRGTRAIQPPSADHKPPASPLGIYKTIEQHIRQFTTSIQNLWNGSVYEKSLDYLLRILLRLHLAPLRESKFKERIQAAKVKRNTEKQPSTLSRKSWKRMVMGLCNELSDTIQCEITGEKKAKRLEEIVKRLKKLHQVEPKVKENTLLSINERIRAMAQLEDSPNGDANP